MARQTVTQRLRKSLTRKINRLAKQGIETGTLKEDIKQMNWRQLKKLASPGKSGRSTFKGLSKYIEENPPVVDTGYNKGMAVLEQLMQVLESPVPTEGYARGHVIQRSPDDISASEYAQNFLLDLLYSRANEVGFSELGNQLEPHAQEIGEALGKVLQGYGEQVNSGMAQLAAIINGGALSAGQWQEYSDFADSFMGDDMSM